MLIWRLRPPITTTWPTPSRLSSWRRMTLSAYSVISRTGRVEVSARLSTGAASGIEPIHARLFDGARQLREDAVDLVPHLLRGDVAVFLEQEADRDDRDAFRRGGAQLVDAADRVHRLFDLVGDLGLDLLGRRAGLHRRDQNRRDVDLRIAVDARAG